MTPNRLAHWHPERGLLHHLLRLPVWLYRAHLGWVLGGRILVLTHTGRRSGRRYRTALEVVAHDRLTDTYIVAAGWGEQAGWYRNLQHAPDAEIAVGRRTLAVHAERLAAEQAERTLCDYARKHPWTFRILADLLLERPEQHPSASVLAQTLPLVALQRRHTADEETEGRKPCISSAAG